MKYSNVSNIGPRTSRIKTISVWKCQMTVWKVLLVEEKVESWLFLTQEETMGMKED